MKSLRIKVLLALIYIIKSLYIYLHIKLTTYLTAYIKSTIEINCLSSLVEKYITLLLKIQFIDIRKMIN